MFSLLFLLLRVADVMPVAPPCWGVVVVGTSGYEEAAKKGRRSTTSAATLG
jgi:hypothetical protein